MTTIALPYSQTTLDNPRQYYHPVEKQHTLETGLLIIKPKQEKNLCSLDY